MTKTLFNLTANVTHQKIALSLIAANPQARTVFEEASLRTLGASLRDDGQLEPILVYQDPGELGYVIVAGERRFRAAKLVGLEALDCVVFPRPPTGGDIARAQILENSLRENLNPIDEANAYRTLMEREGINQAQLAEALHVAPSSVTRALALLELPESLREQLKEKGHLKPGHARELARIADQRLRDEAASRVIDGKLTAAQTAGLVNALLRPKRPGRPKKDKVCFKNLGGFEATVSPTRISLVPAKGKAPRTKEQMLFALEALLQKLRDEFGGATNGQGPALPPSMGSAAT